MPPLDLVFIAFYVTSSFVILDLWKAFAHLICDTEDDPHSTLAYVVVFLFGPLVFVLAGLHRLIEYLSGKHDD